jgi:hypothetical protein
MSRGTANIQFFKGCSMIDVSFTLTNKKLLINGNTCAVLAVMGIHVLVLGIHLSVGLVFRFKENLENSKRKIKNVEL